MTKLELGQKAELYANGIINLHDFITAVDAYSSASNGAKPIVSGALPSNDDIAQAAEDYLQLDRVATKDDVYDAGHFVAGAIWMQQRLVGNYRQRFVASR